MSEMGESSKPDIVRDITDPDVTGQYDPETDTIHLNPELEDNVALAEEYFHRKQVRYLESKGIERSKTRDQLIATAMEAGIIPRIREMGLRNNREDANYEFFRYLTEADKFAEEYTSLTPEEREDFKTMLRGEKLFDGIWWVIDHIEKPDYDPATWQEMAASNPDGSEYWDAINSSRNELGNTSP